MPDEGDTVGRATRDAIRLRSYVYTLSYATERRCLVTGTLNTGRSRHHKIIRSEARYTATLMSYAT